MWLCNLLSTLQIISLLVLFPFSCGLLKIKIFSFKNALYIHFLIHFEEFLAKNGTFKPQIALKIVFREIVFLGCGVLNLKSHGKYRSGDRQRLVLKTKSY